MAAVISRVGVDGWVGGWGWVGVSMGGGGGGGGWVSMGVCGKTNSI